jgi:hypothetical protein
VGSLRGRPSIAIGALAFSGGCILVALDSTAWYFGQQYFALFDEQSVLTLVFRYYLVEAIAVCITVIGAYLMFRGFRGLGTSKDQDSVWTIIGESLASRGDLGIGLAAAVLYGVVYLLISSILVYQPTVDFLAAYGVSSPGWNAAACCGAPGTVPVLIVYLLPSAHIALQVLPLDALFAVIVPLLVGLNVAVAAHAMRNRMVRANAGWLGSLGVLAGLFTGCPTCAGLFLAGAVGGFGATSLAVALAPYQLLFILLSIPLLVVSPVIVSLYARRAIRATCPVPLPPKV